MVTSADVSQFLFTVKSSSNYDFTNYSEKSIQRRVEKLLIDYGMDLTTISNKIRNDKIFLEKVIKDITVNTTELFRDPQVWINLKYRILPQFRIQKTIFIWHAGCSTGQEVYSMLILLNELDLLDKAKIYATDINEDVIEKAKKGVYPYLFNLNYLENFDKVIKTNPYNFEEQNNVPFEKYFDIDRNKDTITVKPFLQDRVVYRKHDLVTDDNIFYSKFDIILCRNVIIYFNSVLQNRVLEMCSNNLYKGGYLVLGLHEGILGSVANGFERVRGIYKKKPNSLF